MTWLEGTAPNVVLPGACVARIDETIVVKRGNSLVQILCEELEWNVLRKEQRRMEVRGSYLQLYDGLLVCQLSYQWVDSASVDPLLAQ